MKLWLMQKNPAPTEIEICSVFVPEYDQPLPRNSPVKATTDLVVDAFVLSQWYMSLILITQVVIVYLLYKIFTRGSRELTAL